MAQQLGIVQEGVDRVRVAFDSIENEVHRVGRGLQARRRSVKRQIQSGRKDLEKRTRRIRSDIGKNPIVKRAQGVQREALSRFEQGVDSVLNTLQIASKYDVERLDRRLTQLNRKVKELEQARKTNGSGAAPSI